MRVPLHAGDSSLHCPAHTHRTSRRGSDNNAPAERLVNQLLTEMDGIDGRVVGFMN
jgi:hypothetical protein